MLNAIKTGLFALTVSIAFAGNAEDLELVQPLENQQEQIGTGQVDDEVGGLILNRTITVLGQIFYDQFNSFWRLNYADDNSNLTIYERPTARFGSEIWVEYRGRQVVRLFLNPRRSAVEESAQSVAKEAYNRVSQIRLTELFEDRTDIDGDEL